MPGNIQWLIDKHGAGGVVSHALHLVYQLVHCVMVHAGLCPQQVTIRNWQGFYPCPPNGLSGK